jgi:hypothetical protein
MANYYGTSRSNYFRVKDIDAFREWCSDLELHMIEEPNDRVGFYVENESGSLPCYRCYEDEDGEWVDEDVDFEAELAEHLMPGHVAIVMEVGAEKARYLVGYAVAINSKGETRRVGIDDIYPLAGELGEFVTEAAY